MVNAKHTKCQPLLSNHTTIIHAKATFLVMHASTEQSATHHKVVNAVAQENEPACGPGNTVVVMAVVTVLLVLATTSAVVLISPAAAAATAVWLVVFCRNTVSLGSSFCEGGHFKVAAVPRATLACASTARSSAQPEMHTSV